MAFYRGSRSGATLRDHNDHVNADDDHLNDDNDDDDDDCDYDDGDDEEGEALILYHDNCDHDTRLKTIPMWMIMMLPAHMMKMMLRTHKLSL